MKILWSASFPNNRATALSSIFLFKQPHYLSAFHNWLPSDISTFLILKDPACNQFISSFSFSAPIPSSEVAHSCVPERPLCWIRLIRHVSGPLGGTEYWESGSVRLVCWYELRQSKERQRAGTDLNRECAKPQRVLMAIRPPTRFCGLFDALQRTLASWGGSVSIRLCLARFEKQGREWDLAE